ncbi:MAG TPA: fimbrial protein [Rhodanobacteraceae bacterium]|nr:fimbrial protein [Rhodanobacteraceae bacterium]
MHLTLPSPLRCGRTVTGKPQRALRMFYGCLLLIGVTCVPRMAWATCWFTSGSATTVTFNAGTITLTPNTAVGTVLWTSNTASPANPPVLDCDGNTNGGIFNTIAASTAVNGDNTLMPTGIPGVSYRLLHPDASTKLALYPDYSVGRGSSTYSVTTNLQLVYTGPYLPPNNSTLTGQLSQWKIDICDKPNLWLGILYLGCDGSIAPRSVETFNISATIRIQVPTCDVAPGSVDKVVTLPSVTTTQLATNPTPGSTPFSLQLVDCPANQKVFINLDTANPYTGASGVIAPTPGAGYAARVGVQVLKADGSTPVAFGNAPSQAIFTGTTSGSSYAIDLYARYYRTGTPVTAGSVKGIATYTINYQ